MALQTVFRGLREGLQLIRPGDTILLVIQSNLAFGARGSSDGKIPPDAMIVFRVELLSIER